MRRWHGVLRLRHPTTSGRATRATVSLEMSCRVSMRLIATSIVVLHLPCVAVIPSIPERIRTSNLRLRRPTIYPVDLRGHVFLLICFAPSYASSSENRRSGQRSGAEAGNVTRLLSTCHANASQKFAIASPSSLCLNRNQRHVITDWSAASPPSQLPDNRLYNLAYWRAAVVR